MATHTIKISRLDTRENIHALMRGLIAMPAYYGENFDALYDVLTDLGEKTVISIDYEGKTLRELPGVTLTALAVLFDAASANPRLTITRAAEDRY